MTSSIQARLKNYARDNKIDFNLVIRLYMQEGVLRRIASSKFAEGFILKGGLLLFSQSHFKSRPTKDIDLLGRNISNEVFFITKTFKEILDIQLEDSLFFHTNGMEMEPITEEAHYQGQRLKVQCSLGNIRTNLKLDIGFGGQIYPNPIEITYPSILDSVGLRLLAYSLESVIAEKFEAMIVLDAKNSRMKDFYDVFELLCKNDIDSDSLKEAIRLTFQSRDTYLPDIPAVFSNGFEKNKRNLQMWESFLNRIKADHIDFKNVIEVIQDRLEPIYQHLKSGE